MIMPTGVTVSSGTGYSVISGGTIVAGPGSASSAVPNASSLSTVLLILVLLGGAYVVWRGGHL